MNKNIEAVVHKPKELVSLFIAGPGLKINPQLRTLYETTEGCLMIGDGKSKINIELIKEVLKERNKVITNNTRIDINAHGEKFIDDDNIEHHTIGLGKQVITYKFVFDLSKINNPHTIALNQVHIRSCYGDTAVNENAINLLKSLNTTVRIFTHIEDTNQSSGLLSTLKQIASIKDYLKNTFNPHEQFIYDIPRSIESASIVEIEADGYVHKFSTTRISSEEIANIIINTLEPLAQSNTALAELTKIFLYDEGRKFRDQFGPIVDKNTYKTMNKALNYINNLDHQEIKNFITGTLLHLIFISQHSPSVNNLIKNLLPVLTKHGIDLEGNLSGVTPLLLAININNPEIVEILLNHGASPNHGIQMTPLNLACGENNEAIVRLLLEHGANVNDFASLSAACRENNTDIIKLLLNHNADTTQISWDLSPLSTACNNNSIDAIQLLIVARYIKEYIDKINDLTLLKIITSEVKDSQIKVPKQLFTYTEFIAIEDLTPKMPNNVLAIDQEQGTVQLQLNSDEDIKKLQEAVEKREIVLKNESISKATTNQQQKILIPSNIQTNLQNKMSILEESGTRAKSKSLTDSRIQKTSVLKK